MAATRVLLVSDSHLAERTPEALDNWAAVVGHVSRGGHDLVVHGGDVTVDGPRHPEDLMVARAALDRLPCPVVVVPGNHDVGELATREGLDRYRDTLGPDRWSLDLPGWRLIGIDTLLFGSGLDDEEDQWRWLDAALRARPAPARIGVVVHKPLHPTPLRPEDAKPGRYVPPAARARLAELLADVPVGLVVSGHVHQFSQHRRDGITHLWVPSCWAIIPDRAQITLGTKTCGAVELTLADDGTSDIQLVRPLGLTQNVIGDTIPDPYQRH